VVFVVNSCEHQELPRFEGLDTLATPGLRAFVDDVLLRDVCRLTGRAIRLWENFASVAGLQEERRTDEDEVNLLGIGRASGVALMECAEKVLEKHWIGEHGLWDLYIHNIACESPRLAHLAKNLLAAVMLAVYVRFKRIDPKPTSNEDSAVQMTWARHLLKLSWQALEEAMNATAVLGCEKRSHSEKAPTAAYAKIQSEVSPVSKLAPGPRVVAAAYQLQSEGKRVSVNSACVVARVDRANLRKNYPEAVDIIRKLAASDYSLYSLRHGVWDRRTGSIDCIDDDQDSDGG
jgi:hypothetical protein